MKRLQQELKYLSDKYDAEIVDNNISHWYVALEGPENTPYFGCTFLLEIIFSKNYPREKPEIVFKTPIYHPNISHKGEICMGEFASWKPQTTVLDLLNYISTLLSSPDPNNPLEAQIAIHYLSNRKEYEEKAKMLAMKYAS